MKDSDGLVRQVVKNSFCKKPTGTQPPYKAAPLLIVEPTGAAQGTALTLRQARSGLRMQYPYISDNIKKIYKKMELVRYSRRTDMTCVSIALMFLGQANSMIDGSGMVGDDGTEGVPPTCKGLISKNEGLQNRLLEFDFTTERSVDKMLKKCFKKY